MVKLIWDLNDGEGIYNSVHIDNALNCGYQIEIKEGWYWNETATVFDSYIESLYQFKKNVKKSTAQCTLAKLMNGLYGKTIQKPILDENKIVWVREDFIKYHIKKSLSDGNYYLTFQDEDNLKDKITKAVYLGSFILGYSRRIMLGYLKKSNNPYFDSAGLDDLLEHAPFYTDTDSIQIHQRNLKGFALNMKLVELVKILALIADMVVGLHQSCTHWNMLKDQE